MRKKRIKIISGIFIAIMILIVLISVLPGSTFNKSILDTDSIHTQIETVTSGPFYGRLTGSDENEKLLVYIEEEFKSIGLLPAGVSGTYYQPFSTVSVQIDTDPVFEINFDGKETLDFEMYEDYNLLPSMNGGGIEFNGELIFLKEGLYSADADSIKNRIVIIESDELKAEQIDYVIKNGGRGIFCCADYSGQGRLKTWEQKKSLSSSGKTGQSVAAGYISQEMYSSLLDCLKSTGVDEEQSIIGNVSIKADIEYPIVETANILGKIEGSSKNGEVLILSANIDGAGCGTGERYFEGAVRNASGLAVLLEIARVIAAQETMPYQTIVFAGLNGQEQDFSGSGYYTNNPVFPLEKTTVVHIGTAGVETKNGLLIASDKAAESTALRDAIIDYSESVELLVGRSVSDLSAIKAFADKKVEAAQLSDEYITYNEYDDTIASIDKDYLDNACRVILGYIEITAFPHSAAKSGSFREKVFAVINRPVVFIKNIFESGTDTIDSIGENRQVIAGSVWKSLQLLICGLLLSVIVGVVSGLLSGYRAKKRSQKSLVPLIGLSIPDVLIILLGWRISAFYGMHLPAMEAALPITSFIMPLITISILPVIYISRITFITVQEELKKDYLRNSKAKGFSRRRIIFSELLPAPMYKIIDTLPTIMTMLIGNLIVAELLFNYLGAAYYLLYFYSSKAYFETAIYILIFGTIYAVFTWLLQLIAKSFGPVKREVIK